MGLVPRQVFEREWPVVVGYTAQKSFLLAVSSSLARLKERGGERDLLEVIRRGAGFPKFGKGFSKIKKVFGTGGLTEFEKQYCFFNNR